LALLANIEQALAATEKAIIFNKIKLSDPVDGDSWLTDINAAPILEIETAAMNNIEIDMGNRQYSNLELSDTDCWIISMPKEKVSDRKTV
jgi:hypothetical protein